MARKLGNKRTPTKRNSGAIFDEAHKTGEELLQHALQTWHDHGCNFTEAARAVGLSRTTFIYRVQAAQKRGLTLVDAHNAPSEFSFSCPGSWAHKPAPFHIGGERKIVAFSDIHYPYHDPRAVDVTLEHAYKIGADTLLINGDAVDHYSLSRYEKNPLRRKFPEELEAMREFLAMLRKAFPKAWIIWNEGNHEVRLDAYLAKQTPDMYGLVELSIPSLYHLPVHGIDYVKTSQDLISGHLHWYHGHEWRLAGIHAATNLMRRCGVSAVAGHVHRDTEDSFTSDNGSYIMVQTSGTLGDLSPEFAVKNGWTQSFHIVHKDAEGMFEIERKRIVNGKVR